MQDLYVMNRLLTRPLDLRFFDSLGEVDGVYDIKDFKRNVIMKRPYQCATAVYQLAKLRMLEFYYDFLDISVDKNLSCAL